MAVFIKFVLFIYVLYVMFTTIQSKGLTWFEAQRCCASRSGQLATINDTIVSCNTIPSRAETLWTGNIRKPSEWIEFQGCYALDGVLDYENDISKCYQRCLIKQHTSFKYFAFKETMCICDFLKPIRKLDAKAMCLRADQIHYSWVYKVLYNAFYDGYGNCVVSKCTNGSERNIAETCTSLQIQMCGLLGDNGVYISSKANWTKSQSNCKTPNSKENHATDVCELIKDTTTETGMWTNIFRVEISSHVDHADKINMTDISSCAVFKCINNQVNIIPYYTNCSETADVFFCKEDISKTRATVSASVTRLKSNYVSKQTAYSSFLLTGIKNVKLPGTVTAAVSRSVDVITTHKPSYTITNITPTMDQHHGNKPEATNIGLICGVTVGGVVLIAVIVIITCKMRNVGPFRKRLPEYTEDNIEMNNSIDCAIPVYHDTVLNTDN